ncbi:MAG: hypothetical protein SVV03_00225 [Candidatus Nanohaloarchaea archaeon]|nr:hypothetical protein [Candidatus Nanohaloarchaea archaeon]
MGKNSSYILIYDSHCPYCTATAKLARRFLSGKIDTLEYRSDEAQDMLKETFKDPGFTLYLFGESKVYYGSKAAEKTGELLNLPRFLVSFFSKAYPYLVKLFSILSFRKRKMELPSHYNCRSCTIDRDRGGIHVREE